MSFTEKLLRKALSLRVCAEIRRSGICEAPMTFERVKILVYLLTGFVRPSYREWGLCILHADCRLIRLQPT